MRNIRSALAAGLLVFGGAAVASAQQTTGTQVPQRAHSARTATQRSARGHGMAKQLYKGISLSASEKANIKNVHAKYAQQMKALRGPNVTEEQRAQAMQLRSAERNELRNTLAPANQAKFDENAAQMKAHAEKRLAKGKVNPRAAGRPPRA